MTLTFASNQDCWIRYGDITLRPAPTFHQRIMSMLPGARAVTRRQADGRSMARYTLEPMRSAMQDCANICATNWHDSRPPIKAPLGE